MKPTTPDILHEIWSHGEGEYVFLPLRSGTTWNEGPWFYPGAVGNVTTLRHQDQYFTPLKYTGTRRRRENVGRPGVLFADLDDGAHLGPFTPHLLVASSLDHMHAYFFLDRPYELDEWEPHARGLSLALGADPGGWDSTQVLRIPGTLNHKYDPPIRVSVLDYRPDMARYRLDDFPEAERPAVLKPVSFAVPDGDPAERNRLLNKFWEHLSLEDRHLLTMTPDQAKWGVRDRSKVIHMVASSLLEVGATVEEAFAIISLSPWNKFATRPKYLWEGIAKIAASRETSAPRE